MTSNSTMTGIILAAGKGSRMMRLRTSLPKPALPVLDKPIIYHQLEMMRRLGIREAIIVVGDRGFEIVREIERLPDVGIAIQYVQQEEPLGIAHCVGRLEGLVDKPFMLFLGDIYFHAPEIPEMAAIFSQPGVDAVLGAVEEEDESAIAKNFCIHTDATGRVTRLVEKPRYPQSRLKGVGVYLFDPVVFDAIRRTPRTAMRDEYEITDTIQILIDDGHHVRVCKSIEKDLNVTCPKDLLTANLEILDREGLQYYIAEDAKIGAGATIENAVIGRGAVVGKGASVIDSVVFASGTVPDGEALVDAIVTESEVLRL